MLEGFHHLCHLFQKALKEWQHKTQRLCQQSRKVLEMRKRSRCSQEVLWILPLG